MCLSVIPTEPPPLSVLHTHRRDYPEYPQLALAPSSPATQAWVRTKQPKKMVEPFPALVPLLPMTSPEWHTSHRLVRALEGVANHKAVLPSSPTGHSARPL